MTVNLDKFIADVLEGLNPKQIKVINGRYGLKTGKIATLQEIGDELDITRERVRQIEEQGLKKLEDKVKEKGREFLVLAKEYLEKAGGVREDETFVKDLAQKLAIESSVKHFGPKLRFIFFTAGEPFYHDENDEVRAFWYAHSDAKKDFFDLVKKITNLFEKEDKEKLLQDKIYLEEYKDFPMAHFHLLSIPKHFGVNVFGDFGLMNWPEINPKTIKDKAYLALKKTKKPLHFSEIADVINDYGIDEKKAHMQTVHNELIKDGRFVLVGRGIYALREHGFEPGTVSEVITRLLKKHGPLKSAEIVKRVNEQRLLKENTILINLQNRRYFKRLADGRYDLK